MMYHCRRAFAVAALFALAVGSFGCSGLNPALFNTPLSDPISGLAAPEGTILIVVMNYTVSDTLTRLNIHKENEGVMTLGLAANAFNPSSLLDYVVAVQDCNIERIEFVDVQVRLSVGGAPVAPATISFSRPPLVNGESLYCGKVVAITIGSPGDITPSQIDVAVY